MPVNSSVVRFAYDAETAFRAHGSAAITADGGTASVAIPGAKAYWDAGVHTDLEWNIVIDVEAGTFASHSYVLAAEFDADGNFGAGNVVTRCSVAPTATGQYVISVPREAIPADARFARVNVDVTGATPSITFAAWMAPAARR